MRITKDKYKNIFAIRLETENSTALVLPEQGGKITSFRSRKTGKEYLLQNPSVAFLRTGLQDDFEKGECSGFDDMFPTIDPVCVDGKEYPDHGEVCRVPFSYVIDGDSLRLRYISSLGYTYQKVFCDSKKGGLACFYEIENTSNRDFRALWAAHCLVRMETGGELELPFEENEPVDFVDDTTGTFAYATRVPYTREYLSSDYDGKPMARKVYFPRACPIGRVAYRYETGERLVLEFDNMALPYLGIWQDFGVVNGSRYIGLEPCTHGYDTVLKAEKFGQNKKIKKGEILKFWINLHIGEDNDET